jgi:hypothetical protein
MRQLQPRPWEQTDLFDRWARSVRDGRPNDFVIVISPSSKTGVSGTGKTTCAVSLAEEFDVTDDGFDAEATGTTDISELAYDILVNAEEGSAIILDEAQGTPSGTGLNKRRGMKSETLDTVNSILANRDNRFTLIIVVQQLSMLDASMLPLIDAWLLITKEPDDPRGPQMTHHEIYGDDYELKADNLKTPAPENLTWPPMVSNYNYAIMERKKQAAKQRGGGEDGEEEQVYSKEDLPTKVRNEIIVEHYEETEATQEDIADRWDLTRQRVQQIISDE